MKLSSDWRMLHNALTTYQSAVVECRVNRIDPYTALMYRDGHSVREIKDHVAVFDTIRLNADIQRKLGLYEACNQVLERDDITADERAKLRRNVRWLEEDLRTVAPEQPSASRFQSLVIRLYRARDFLMRVIEVYYRVVSLRNFALCSCCATPTRISMQGVSKFARSTLEWLARAVAVLEQEAAASPRPLYDLDTGFDEMYQQITALQGWRHLLPMYVDDMATLTLAAPFFRRPSLIAGRQVSYASHVVYESWNFRRPSLWNKRWVGAGPSTVPWSEWPVEDRASLKRLGDSYFERERMVSDMGRSMVRRSMRDVDWAKIAPMLEKTWCLSEFYGALVTFYDKYKRPIMRI